MAADLRFLIADLDNLVAVDDDPAGIDLAIRGQDAVSPMKTCGCGPRTLSAAFSGSLNGAPPGVIFVAFAKHSAPEHVYE